MRTALATRPAPCLATYRGDLSTTGGVADVDDVAQAEVRHHGGGVRCVVVHVVPVADLGGAPVPAAVVGR